MCGIAAIAGSNRGWVEQALTCMTRDQRHRGPDDEGAEFYALGGDKAGATLGLGHRRLSIMDLSPLGHQPMVHPTTGDVIIFNGEIYNFEDLRSGLEKRGVTFRGHSDTEVLLHALVEWGPDALRELAGMFAFAFYRPRERKLLIARDPLGIKPLYVARSDKLLGLSSEVRPLVAAGVASQKPSRKALATLLAYGSVQEPLTFFEDVQMFPGGCYQWMKFDGDGTRHDEAVVRYWDFPRVNRNITHDDAVERLKVKMARSVREHLIADVPVGCFLSSGIDSTVIAALAHESSARVATFTLGFLNQPDLSESDMARDSARSMGVAHHDIQITSENALDLTRRWMETLDQPSLDGLNTYIVSKAVRDAGIIVALSGLGGDELFGGYPAFTDVPKLYRLNARLQGFSPRVRGLVMGALGLGKPATVRAKLRDIGNAGPDLLRLYLHRRRANSDETLQSLGLSAEELGLDATYQPFEAIARAGNDDEDHVAAISRYESQFFMGCMLLRDSDATSMQHSMEIRVPFLDRRVLDLAYSIPGDVRLPGRTPDKHLLRTAYSKYLRPELLKQGKRGFTLPIRRWMLTSLRPMCEEGLISLKATGLVNERGVDAIWREFLANPEHRVWSHAFLLCVLGMYLRRDWAARPTP